MKRQRLFRHRHQGYILPMTLAVLALVALGAAFVAQRADLAVAIAGSEQEKAVLEAQIADALADVMYRLATEPRLANGLGTLPTVVHLDGRLYAYNASLAVSLQDARGLLNVNTTGLKNLQSLLATYGVPATRAADMYNVLQDYIDADDLVRLNGAESAEYAALKLPPPRNAALNSPRELRAMPLWKDTKALWGDDPLDNHVQTVDDSLLNPVNATWRVLATIGDLDATLAQRIVHDRLVMDPREFTGRLPRYNDATNPYSNIVTYPSEVVLVTFWVRNAYWGYRYSVTHATHGSPTPWRIDYAYRVERKENKLPDTALAPWTTWRKTERKSIVQPASPF